MTGTALVADVLVRRGEFVLEAAVVADPGEVVAVMGPSGAGKSTLFDAIAGLVSLADGRVLLDARAVQTASGALVPQRERGTVLLGQEPRLFPHLTARENVAFGLRARRVPRRLARRDADAWLDRVGLAGLGDRHPSRLSGGQKQRVALARALATSPRLLLLDEPVTSLDLRTAAEIRELLRQQLTATGTTALIATQDPADAVALAHRLVILEHGRVTQHGTVHEVLHAPATPFAEHLAPRDGGHELWLARVLNVDSDAAGVHVRAADAGGHTTVLTLPPGTAVPPDAAITVRSSTPGSPEARATDG